MRFNSAVFYEAQGEFTSPINLPEIEEKSHENVKCMGLFQDTLLP